MNYIFSIRCRKENVRCFDISDVYSVGSIFSRKFLPLLADSNVAGRMGDKFAQEITPKFVDTYSLFSLSLNFNKSLAVELSGLLLFTL